MSIDRRIVSILYHNGIFDIEDVEKFVGEKDNYYEIIIDGELKKLKIPGKEYVDEITTEFDFDEIESVENSFEEEMKKSDDENDLFLEKINKEEDDLLKYFHEQLNIPSKIPESKKEEVKEIFKTPDLEEIVKENKENKKLVVTKTEVKVTKPKTQKNTTKKNTTDDIDDFMNTI